MKKYEIATKKEVFFMCKDVLATVMKGRAVRAEVKSMSTKTKEQLGYYWSVIIPRVQQGMKAHGNELSQDEVNLFLNDRFFSVTKSIIIKRGKDEYVFTMRVPRSKSGAAKDEMAEFIDKVIRWASADLEIYIPKPFWGDPV